MCLNFEEFFESESENAKGKSKIKNLLSLSIKNPSFLANIFSTSQIIDEVKKVKLLSKQGFSLSVNVAKKNG